MTALEDKLRAALGATADEIPPQAPPLRLHPRPGRRAWTAWAAPLASAATVVVLIAASLAIAVGIRHPQTASPQPGLDGIPAYYVALSDIHDLGAMDAELRSTATGAVLAKVTPPRPYVSFTGVTGAADDRTFVLSAQGANKPPADLSARQYLQKYPHGYYPAQRFFLLRIDPGSRDPGSRISLTALSAAYTPANDAIHDMALSPDGTLLAANVGGLIASPALSVFDLATGTERAWSARTCAGCVSGGGLAYGGVNVDTLSWTADGQHVAFVWGAEIRLLDTRAPGSNLVADSKLVATWTVGLKADSMLRGAIITPDGRTVLCIDELASLGPDMTLREHLVAFSAATGRQTAILNNLNVLKLKNGYEQILYTNATGSELVITGLRPGRNASILQGGRSTPIPWSPSIYVAAW
jgi:hypothetical protein